MDIGQRRKEHFIAWLRAHDTNSSAVAKAAGIPYTTLNDYENGPTRSLNGLTEAKIAAAFGEPIEAIFGMAYAEPNHLRAWRVRLGMTEELVAQRLGSSVAVLRLLEGGEYAVSRKRIAELAAIYRLGQGMLYLDPAEVPDDVLDLFRAVEERHSAQQVIDKARTG